MTDTKSKLVYLAGPIDDVAPYNATWWRDRLCEVLTELGHAVYNPYGAWSQTEHLRQHAEACRKVNRQAISSCNLVIAYLGGKGRGFGTIREIEFARGIGINVVIIADGLMSLEACDCTTIGIKGINDRSLIRDAIKRLAS